MSETERNYPSNSHTKRVVEKTTTVKKEIPEKKIDKIVQGKATQRKKGLGKKIAETFTGDDAKSVGEYVLFDVMIPASKAMISDALSQGVERMLFGEVRRRAPGAKTSYTSYNRMHTSTSPGRAFQADGPTGAREVSRRARAAHDFDEIILTERGEAEAVIDALVDLIDLYGVATVSDLYGLVGVTGSFTDDKWGWTDLRVANVSRVREGYLLNLPKPGPID